MIDELESLLTHTPVGADKATLISDIVEANVIDKPTVSARSLTARHLTSLYSLDQNCVLFRVLRRLWESDTAARPVLALTLSLARDPILRLSEPFVLGLDVGAQISREDTEAYLHKKVKDRFSAASLRSYSQNINGTWTQAGYLNGKRSKIRQRPTITPTNVAYALFLAYLEGSTGERLFQSSWTGILDQPIDRLRELAGIAAQRGLLVYKHTGGVTEVRFPDYLTDEEVEALQHE